MLRKLYNERSIATFQRESLASKSLMETFGLFVRRSKATETKPPWGVRWTYEPRSEIWRCELHLGTHVRVVIRWYTWITGTSWYVRHHDNTLRLKYSAMPRKWRSFESANAIAPLRNSKTLYEFYIPLGNHSVERFLNQQRNRTWSHTKTRVFARRCRINFQWLSIQEKSVYHSVSFWVTADITAV